MFKAPECSLALSATICHGGPSCNPLRAGPGQGPRCAHIECSSSLGQRPACAQVLGCGLWGSAGWPQLHPHPTHLGLSQLSGTLHTWGPQDCEQERRAQGLPTRPEFCDSRGSDANERGLSDAKWKPILYWVLFLSLSFFFPFLFECIS